MRSSIQNDITLLARLKARDETALDDLIDAYGTKIYQLAFRYLRNKEDAEEVAQDVLYKVYRKVGAFRGDAALSSWIYRITFNAAMSRLRTAKYQRAQVDERRSFRAMASRWCRRQDVRSPTGPTGRRAGFSGHSCAGGCSARFSRCRRSTARRSCCATFRGCRPKRRARCCA